MRDVGQSAGEGAVCPTRSTPSREKRRTTVYLRGLLLVAAGGILLESGAVTPGSGALIVLVLLTLSNLALLSVPLRLAGSLRFELIVGAIDVVFVAAAIYHAGRGAQVLPVSCLMMVLVVALGNYRARAIAGAAVVGALHVWLMLAAGPGVGRELAPQLFFLGSIALYYGYLSQGLHDQRIREQADSFERRELETLLEILAAITSSLEIKQVTRTVVTKIAEIIPAVRCSMLLVEADASRCFVLASHDDPELDMLEIDLDNYPEVRRAIETRNPVLIDNVSDDPLVAEVRNVLEELDFQSIMVLPLVFGDDVLGTLCLKTARANQEFSKREIAFCTAVARASSNALKNALLHRRVHEESARHRGVGDKLSRIFDHSPGVILTTDNEGRITEFNRGGEQLLGHRRDEVLGRAWEAIFGDEDVLGIVERVRSAGSLSNYACRLRKSDQSELNLEFNISALQDEEGRVTGTVWLGRDVTELKATHTQLLQAKKLSTIGEVISGVAHELNNPLSGVLGFSQLLMARHGEGPMGRDLEKIYESAQRCQKIVKNLLAFSRGHKPERKYLGVNGIIEKTLDIKSYQLQVNNIEVVCELDPDLPRTMLDFHQMQQVLLNLINNAQQAMGTGAGHGGEIRIRTSHADGLIRVEVCDSGSGMDGETLDRIFDPFFTTKEPGEGTGLGLSVSYGIVKEHGGRIHAQSEVGEGTTFVIELPAYREAEAGTTEALGLVAAEKRKTRTGERVLVVDDEATILDLLIEVLDDAGYMTDTASNGSEACRKLRAGDYDVVITDVRMPRMDGMELYSEILNTRPEMKNRVIFSTGDLMDPETVRFLEDAGARTIAKPLEIGVILRAVEDTLRQRVPAGQTS